MGAFYSNLQLFSTNSNKEKYREKIIEYIEKSFLDNGYTKVRNRNSADSSIIVGPIDSTPWVALYDEDSDSELDWELIDEFSQKVTGDLQCTAINIIVYDSNVLRLTLLNNGEIIDVIKNDTENFQFNEPNIDCWKTLFDIKNLGEEFKLAFNNDSCLVEPILEKIRKLIYLNPNHCFTGYRYIKEDGLRGITKLNFKKNNSIFKTGILGLTKFALNYAENGVKPGLNKEGILKVSITNQGQASTGFEIFICGPAIENEELKAVSLKLITINNDENEKNEQQFILTKSKDERKVFYAKYDTFKIKSGYAPIYPIKIKDTMKDFNERQKSAFTLEITLKSLSISLGEFYFFCVPLVNSEEGAFWFPFNR